MWAGQDGADMDDPAEYSTRHQFRFLQTVSIARRFWTPGQTIASIGVSPFDPHHETYFQGSEFTCVVPSTSFVLGLPPVYREGRRFFYYDLTRSGDPPNRCFDMVIMAEVLEHLLADDELVLRRALQLVCNKGYLVLTVPNFVRHVNRFKVLLGLNPLQPKRDIVGGGMGGLGHIREYTLGEVRTLLQRDFNIQILTTINPYGSVSQRRLLRLFPQSFGSTIVAIGRKEAAVH